MINKQKFFNITRDHFGPLTSKQVQGFDMILDKWDAIQFTDIRWLAYMLATAWHETDKKMQAINEYGKGKNKSYGKIDPTTGKAYFGRGLVQLTWDYNYKRMSKVIYGDLRLYVDPDLALDLKVAVEIMFEGMKAGHFTSRKLDQYFNDKKDDPLNARAIINGKDKAALIAGYYQQFLVALS